MSESGTWETELIVPPEGGFGWWYVPLPTPHSEKL